MNFFPQLCRSPDSIAVSEELLDESLPRMPVPLVGPQSSKFGARLSFKPIRSLRIPTKNVEEQVRELGKAYRGMRAADKRYREESELLLQRHEITLAELNRDNLATERRLEELDVEEDAEKLAEMKAEISYYRESKKYEEKRVAELRDAIHDLERDKALAEKLTGGVYAPSELHQTTQTHAEILEDRVEKALSNLSLLEHHNRQLETEMKSLQAEREKHNEQVHQAEAQLDDLLLQQQELLTESFTLYKQRHDFHRMISDLMEMREAAEAYKKWAKYGVWPTLDGERLGHLVMQKVEQLQRQRRSTLPIDDKGLQNKFAINEARTSQTHTILDPEMEKYENALNVKAFNDLQKRLKIPAEDVDALLPALMDARIKYETLSTAVETQSEEVLRLTALRQSEIDKEESIPHNEFDSVNFEDLDNETLTTAMMHEIYELYCEAG